MAIFFAKVTRVVFCSPNNDFHILSLKRFGGDYLTGIYRGVSPPEVRSSVFYQLHGYFSDHEIYGQQFEITHYQRERPPRRSGGSAFDRGIAITPSEHDALAHLRSIVTEDSDPEA